MGAEPWDVREAFRNSEASFLQEGFYYSQLRRYYDLFPREQIRVYLFDDLERDALSLVRSMYTYLEVDPAFEPNIEKRHNVGGFPRSRIVNTALATTARLYERKAVNAVTPAWMVRLYWAVYDKSMNRNFEFPQDLRSQLADLYEDDILKVQDLIQRDLKQWLTR